MSAVDYRRRLRDLIADSGKNVSQLEREIGLGRGQITRVKNEESDTKVLNLQKILHACGSSMAEFFGSRIPDRYPDPSHHELHEALQQMLDAGYYKQMEFFIEAVVQTAPAKPGHLLKGRNFGREGPSAEGAGRKKRGSKGRRRGTSG